MLKNKPNTFLVTGSSSGIGKCIADNLHSCGHHILYHGKLERKMDLPPRCEYIYGDLSKEDVVENLSNYVNEKYEIQGIICCAGRTHLSNIEDVPLSFKIEDMFEILNNIFVCTVLTCQKFSKQLIERKSGKIIIIGGDVVDKPNKNSEMCAYAISKAAVHQYAIYLSNFLRPYNINVNVVAPTGVFRNDDPIDYKKTLIRRSCKKEIANLVSFLCNEDNFISGQILRVNGARSNYFDL